jgi:hypothetical protein
MIHILNINKYLLILRLIFASLDLVNDKNTSCRAIE